MTGKKYRKQRKKSTYVSKGTGSKILHTPYGDIARPRRKRGSPKISLRKRTERVVREVNERLDSLQRRYGKGTWASKKLMNRLSKENLKVWTGKGKIKLKKNMTKTQLTAINKAANQFLVSATSTNKGIQDVKRRTIEQLRKTWSIDREKEMTTEEAETFYEMFGEKDFEALADKIGSSEMQAFIQEAINSDLSENQFITMLRNYGLDTTDLDLKEKAQRLYDKYVL